MEKKTHELGGGPRLRSNQLMSDLPGSKIKNNIKLPRCPVNTADIILPS